MDFTRRLHRDDALFVIALVVPAAVATERYFESDREMTQIAQAQRKPTEAAVDARSTVMLDRVRSTLALHANVHGPVPAQD